MTQDQVGKVGRVDRAARTVLALVLLGFAVFCPFAKTLGPLVIWVSGVVGTVLLVTALVGRCPIYKVLGRRT